MKARLATPILTLVFLIVGGSLAVFPDRVSAHQVWMLGVILLGAPIVFETLRNALKGRFATDVVASLSIIGSVALVITVQQTRSKPVPAPVACLETANET